MEITLDGVLFAMERAYNRSIGKYVFNWDHESITIFGFSFMLKSTIDFRYSPEANKNLHVGLTAEQIRELNQAMEAISVLPRPGFPDGTFTDRQKQEHGITLIANFVYVYRVN